MAERIRVCQKHLEFSIRWKGPTLGIIEMRRHYTNYFKHIPDFKPFRLKLVTSDSFEEISDTLSEIESRFSREMQPA
jgi:tRNA-dihydrouridine synthase